MRAQIIAEVATNHGGSILLAKDFIAACADAGADWVKFQSFQVKHLNPADPQYGWFQQSELSDAAHVALMTACAQRGVRFLTTVYTADRMPFLKSLGLDTIKIGSGEAGEASVCEAAAAAKFSQVFVSCGLGSTWFTEDNIIVMHCCSLYPTPVPGVLARRSFGQRDGWSDHCVGIEVAKAAIAKGAAYLEKHVTLPYAPRQSVWDATMAQIRALRQYAEFIETVTSGEPPDLAEARARFVGRWQYQTEEHEPGCPAIADDESDQVLYGYGECACSARLARKQ